MSDSWPDTTRSLVHEADAELQRVGTTIAVAQGLAASGRSIDLTGLDAAAGMLCARVLDLPPTDGAAMRHALADLDRRLRLLAQTLKHDA